MYKLLIKLNDKFNYDGDSGIDLPLVNNLYIEKNNLGEINFGILCEMINLTTNQNTSYLLEPIIIEIVDKLSETYRCNKSFGSSEIKIKNIKKLFYKKIA